MRVLHILDHSLPIHSGYTFRTRAILKAQEGLGIAVRGITGQRHELDAVEPSAHGAVDTHDGLTFHRTAGTPTGPAGISEMREIKRFADSIKATVNAWKPDILHAHSPALNGAAALQAARALDIPLVYEIRAFWEDAAVGNRSGKEGSPKYLMTRALETQIVSRADAVFTICQGLRDDLIKRGIGGGKIGVMPNGVDLSLFGDPPPRDESLAKELGIATDAPVIGYIGSFYDYEGVDDLIAAMPILRETHCKAKLILVGGGELDTEWRALAAQLPDPDSVIFTGRVPHSEVERYYSLIDVLAYPRKASRLTDLVTPLKPLEAMAQRRLVAASNVGGHRELIKHGETGTLFTPDDPAACAAALSELLNAPEEWDGMCERAANHVRDRHDWAINAERYASVYHLLLSGKGREASVVSARPKHSLNA